MYRTMGQFTKDIKQKNGIEQRKQQAKEHRKQTDFLEECKKNFNKKTEIVLKIPLFISVKS